MTTKNRERLPQEITLQAREWIRTHPAIRDGRPLIVGALDPLCKQAPADLPPAAVRIALHEYCSSSDYLRAVAKGGPRYALDGTPTEQVITEHQKGYSEGTLAERRRWEKRKEKARARWAAAQNTPPPAEPTPLKPLVDGHTDYGRAVKRAKASAKDKPSKPPGPKTLRLTRW